MTTWWRELYEEIDEGLVNSWIEDIRYNPNDLDNIDCMSEQVYAENMGWTDRKYQEAVR